MDYTAELPGKFVAGLDNLVKNYKEIPAGIAQSVSDGYEWFNSPIPAQAIARAEDKLIFSTPEQLGERLVDTTLGAATGAVGGFIGGRLVDWAAGRWALRAGMDAQGSKFVFRSDNDFSSTTNEKGAPKAYINADNDLVPPNLNGEGSIQSHIRGGNSKDSPYISTTDPVVAGEIKNYGAHQIAIDVGQMQKDIDAGKLPNVEFLDNASVKSALQQKVDQAERRFAVNPSDESARRLKAAQQDLENATRDGECLIKGCVPSQYIKPVKK